MSASSRQTQLPLGTTRLVLDLAVGSSPRKAVREPSSGAVVFGGAILNSVSLDRDRRLPGGWWSWSSRGSWGGSWSRCHSPRSCSRGAGTDHRRSSSRRNSRPGRRKRRDAQGARGPEKNLGTKPARGAETIREKPAKSPGPREPGSPILLPRRKSPQQHAEHRGTASGARSPRYAGRA